MNNFASLFTIKRYKYVTFYSVQLERDEISLFERFLIAHEKSNSRDLKQLKTLLEIIGNDSRDNRHIFREEKYAHALPPRKQKNSLRLYCMIFNKSHIVLLGGAVKTKQRAQDCPFVAPHFSLANRICQVLHDCIVQKELDPENIEEGFRFMI